MEQPRGFVSLGGYRGKVCKLKKALYGKQLPRAWFGEFSKVVLGFGLYCCQTVHLVSTCALMLDTSYLFFWMI